MKKLLLSVLMLTYVGAFAQQAPDVKFKALSRMNPDLLKMSAPVTRENVNVDNSGPLNRRNITVASTPASSSRSSSTEAIIGISFYDLQTNNTISDRIVKNADGTISAVWTYSPNGTAGYPERGTGYNYFDGTSWMANPATRIENVRTGFTNIVVTSSGKEIAIGHGIQSSGPSKGLVFTSRDTKGTGLWGTDDAILGEYPTDTIDIWPKVAVGGTDGKSVHVICRGGSGDVAHSGQTSPIFYFRSQDDGNTWDRKQVLIPALDSGLYLGFSADNYSIDARNSTVAVVAGSIGTDIALAKSTDNGDTWDTVVVSRFPIPKFDTGMSTDTNADNIPDTLWSGVGDPTVLIDNNDSLHVFFSMVRVIGDGSGLSYFPYTSQLIYWNERNPELNTAIAAAPDKDGDGIVNIPAASTSCSDRFPWGTYGGNTRILEAPSAGVDANNAIYVCYQTVDEFSEENIVESNYGKVFKHPYLIRSTDGGDTWTDFNKARDVLESTQEGANELEGVFAAIARDVDSHIHIVYQRDYYPGTSLAVAGSCDQQMHATNLYSDIVYAAIDTMLNVGVHDLAQKPQNVSLSANYPNPADTYTRFNAGLKSAAHVKVEVTDILGQSVYTENKGRLSMGVHTITLNTAYLSSGIYFYAVTADGEKATGKMIVE